MAKATELKTKAEVEPKPITKAGLKKARQPIRCVSPAGHDVVVRPPNVELHVLSGGLPARLRELAASGVAGIDEAIRTSDGDPELLSYLNGIVCRTLVEPKLDPPVYEWVETEDGERTVELKSGDALDDFLLPIDYKWLLLIAFGEVDVDGVNKRLWGREPLSRFEPFLDEPSGAEDRARQERVGS